MFKILRFVGSSRISYGFYPLYGQSPKFLVWVGFEVRAFILSLVYTGHIRIPD